MKSLYGSLRLRPTRVGFLVDPTNIESIRRVFQVCTCCWGGKYNPIIPVCNEIPEAWRGDLLRAPSPVELAHGYIRFFEPDVFVEAEPGVAERAQLERTEFGFGNKRIISLNSYFEVAGEERFTLPFGVESFDIYRALYEREFRFVPRHDRHVAIFDLDPKFSPFIEAAFGGFPLDGPLKDLSKAYSDAFDPIRFAPNAENWTKVIKEGFAVPLGFTSEGLKRDDFGWTQPIFFIADPSSPLDLIDLWNIRQFQGQVLPVNIDWLKDAKDFINEALRQNFRPLPRNPHGVMIRSTIEFARSIGSGDYELAIKRCQAILDDAGISPPQDGWSMKLWHDRIWVSSSGEDFGPRLQRAEISAATSSPELSVAEDAGHQSIRFSGLAPDFAEEYGSWSPARWVNVLKLSNYGLEDIALTVPSSFSGETIDRLRHGEPLLSSREGLVFPQKFKGHPEYMRLLSGRELAAAWFKQLGIETKPSEPGRIADQVLFSLGGLRGAYLLADRETLKLLDEMAKSVRKFPDGTIEEFPDRSVKVKRWRDLVARRSTGAFSDGIHLDRFIEANVLRLGLAVDCTNCGKTNWQGIKNMDDVLTCERCLKEYPFPQGSLDFKHTPWHYRVVGPYSVPNFAEGAYSTVLSLYVFASRLESSNVRISYATGLLCMIGADLPFEIDFTLWYQRTRTFGLADTPVLVFGEAKSFGAECFKERDVARMRELAELVPGSFFVFSTMKQELSAAEKTMIGDFALWGRDLIPSSLLPRAPVIVLTGTELFAKWNVEHAWKELDGKRATFAHSHALRFENLWTLATVTQQVYLDLPDPHATRSAPAAPAEQRSADG